MRIGTHGPRRTARVPPSGSRCTLGSAGQRSYVFYPILATWCLLLAMISLSACVAPPTSSVPGAASSDVATAEASTADAAASTASTPDPTLATPVEIGPTGLPTSTAVPTSRPTPTPTPTSTPSPTPTPPPLPATCLRQAFAADVQICQAAPRYDIQLTVAPEQARITGRQHITYTNAETEALDTIVLRLLPNAPGYGGTMTVTHLLVSAQSIPYQSWRDGTALRLPLEPPLEPGRIINLSMDFSVDVPTSNITGHGLFSYIRGVMALPTVYPLIPVYNENGWNADMAPVHGDDVFSDVAIYNVEVTAPSAFTLVATGACGTPLDRTWRCKAAPMRDFTVILGENFERVGRETRGVVVNSYFYEWHAAGGAKALEVAVDALEAFTDFFGPYPYTELDVVETPNYLGGMEYSGLVVVEDGLYPGVSTVEWLTAHEVAHQWWMVVVGNDQVNEPWLDEALTQYSTMLYYEAVYGRQRADGILNAVFVQTHQALRSAGRDMAAGLPADAYPSNLYFDIVYDKGALYFHELRERVGDDLFFETLQTYYSRHRYRIATTESFLDTVEEVTGDRHRDLFEKWIAADAEE